MKYKIYKTITKNIGFDKENKSYKLIENTKYYIKRCGKIFGFLHDVGDEIEIWSNGAIFTSLNYFDSLEQAESYLNAWHKKYYKDEKLEIVKYTIK